MDIKKTDIKNMEERVDLFFQKMQDFKNGKIDKITVTISGKEEIK